MTKIYEGMDILHKLSLEGYYQSFQAKMFLELEQEPIAPQKYFTLFHNSFPDNIKLKVFFFYLREERWTHIADSLPVDKWYIVSLYNIPHQQFLDPQLLAINFDIENRKLISPWRYDQLYPGNPNGEPYLYDEWGTLINTSVNNTTEVKNNVGEHANTNIPGCGTRR